MDSLKRLAEWEAVIDMFAADRYATQDAMLEIGRTPNELMALAAQGRTQSGYLSMALERPKKEE